MPPLPLSLYLSLSHSLEQTRAQNTRAQEGKKSREKKRQNRRKEEEEEEGEGVRGYLKEKGFR